MFYRQFKKIVAVFILFNFLLSPVEAATDVKNDANLSTNLISYWEQEQSSGNSSVDSHGSNDLSDNNTVGSVTGQQGNAADYVNSGADYHSKTDPGSWDLDIAGDMSFACWFKLSSILSTNSQVFIFGRDSGQPNRNWYFGLGDSSGTDQMRMYNSSDGTNTNTTGWRSVSIPTLSTGTWYHLAWVYDASAGSIEAWVDGTAHGTTTGLKTSMYTGGTARVVLGQYSPNPTISLGFNGAIDECGVWDKKLTGAEVNDLAANIPYDAGGGGGETPAPTPSFLLISYLLPPLNRVKYVI